MKLSSKSSIAVPLNKRTTFSNFNMLLQKVFLRLHLSVGIYETTALSIRYDRSIIFFSVYKVRTILQVYFVSLLLERFR